MGLSEPFGWSSDLSISQLPGAGGTRGNRSEHRTTCHYYLGAFSFLSSSLLRASKVFVPTTLRAPAWLPFSLLAVSFSLSEGFKEDTARVCSFCLRAPSGTRSPA